ncbi:MAG: polyketide synthase dehydratase domain-containing protein [Gammaproteobacteria bacterium]
MTEMWKVGYQLGSQFRWISKFWRRPGETLTQLRLPVSALEQGKYMIHPGLMDSCFQSSALATMHADFDSSKVDAIYIPFALENLRFFRKPTTTLWCHVKIKNPPANPEEIVESFSHTIQVYDEDGNILIDVETLPQQRPQRSLAPRIAQGCVRSHYDVYWKTLNHSGSLEVKPLAGTYLVGGEQSSLSQAVVRELQVESGYSVAIDTRLVASFSNDNGVVTLNPEDGGQWMALLQAVGGIAKVSGLVYVAPDQLAADTISWIWNCACSRRC